MPALLCVFPHLEMGGADKFNLDLLRFLHARGWSIQIATTLPARHRWHDQFAPLATTILDLAAFPPHEQPARLVQQAITGQPDVVLLSNSELGYAVLPYLRAHLPTSAVLDFCHMEEEAWDGGGYPRMSLRAAPWLDQQVVSSEHLRQWMLERGGDASAISVCTTNIDSSLWHPGDNRLAVRAQLGLPPDAPVVLYPARLERQKQPLLAAAVIRDTLAHVPAAHVLVAGNGLFGGYMRGFVRHHRLGQVHLLGAVPNSQVHDLLAASDVLLLPSEMEGISLAVYEAMAMGVVPLSADVGGQRELVTADTGVLIGRGPSERAAYVAALTRLLRDEPYRAGLAHAARDRVATAFRLEHMGACMLDAFSSAGQRARRRAPGIDRHTAYVAAQQAASIAANYRAIALDTPDATMRTRLRRAYWQQIDNGAWWMAEIGEHLRGILRRQ